MTEVRMPGKTLITGASGSGKTKLTADALDTWVREHGSDDVAILEFGPDIAHEGRRLGARLDRYTRLPPNAWKAVIDTNAPRAHSETSEEALILARENSRIAGSAIEQLPTSVTAMFVNDATIPFQDPETDVDPFLARLDAVEHAVINAYTGDAFEGGTLTEQERAVVERFRTWADEEIRLDGAVR